MVLSHLLTREPYLPIKMGESDSPSCLEVIMSILIWSAGGVFLSIAEGEMGTSSRHRSSGHAHLSW